MQQYAYLLKEYGYQLPIMQKILNDREHKEFQEKSKVLYQRYKAEEDGVPILRRKLFDFPFVTRNVYRVDDKVKNCINRNFEADIVDTKVGYFAGIPVTKSVAGESNFENIMTEWDKDEQSADKDASLAKMAAITGIGYRLLYADKGGNAHVVNLDHTVEDIFILTTGDYSSPDFAIRKYDDVVFDGSDVKTRTLIEFYDDTMIRTFEYDGKLTLIHEQLHFFAGCPLFAVANNDELQGDFEKVIPAIDAYNRTLSDASDEIESNRLAYLVLKGMQLDEETAEQVKTNSVFETYDGDQDVRYLTKDVNDQMIENHLNRLEKNIYKDAKSVDFSDEKFAGNASGVALKYKNQGLENKVSSFERKFDAMLRYQYMLLNEFWAENEAYSMKAERDKYREIKFTYRRNLPEDLGEQAEVQQKLMGVVSEPTRLSLFPAVDDVDEERRLLEVERDPYGVDYYGNEDMVQYNQDESAGVDDSANKEESE